MEGIQVLCHFQPEDGKYRLQKKIRMPKIKPIAENGNLSVPIFMGHPVKYASVINYLPVLPVVANDSHITNKHQDER